MSLYLIISKGYISYFLVYKKTKIKEGFIIIKNSIVKQISKNLIFAIYYFLVFFILSKLLLNSKNVLYITIMWTISSSIGFFIRKSVDATNKGILFGIILKLLVAMIIFIFVAPIVRLLLGITQLSKILLKNILEPLNQ